jgi:decaprenylphospho-beta-D-erythro-pentofuranosid-2-ulose 2-reductase
MKNILIIGASSGMAVACARLWAGRACCFHLIARDAAKLEALAADLTARGASSVHTQVLDVTDFGAHAQAISQAHAKLGSIDLALIAHGTLPDQTACERDATLSLQEFNANGTSVISLLTLLAPIVEQQKQGTLAVISSVAGDRGRPTNYLYGSAKAAVSAFCEGLQARLFKSGVHVLLIKPGFVATPMTAHLELPGALTSTAEQVAQDIDRAIARKTNVLYTAWFWRYIMLIIRHIPVFVFKKLHL